MGLMTAFKKHSVEVDNDVLFDTDAGRLNTNDMVDKINALKKACEEKDKEIADKEAECKSLRDKVAELEDKKSDPKDDDDKDKENADEDKDKDEDGEDKDKGEGKENSMASHEPSTKLNEAANAAMKNAAGAEHLKAAVKANEQPNVAKVSVRSASRIEK